MNNKIKRVIYILIIILIVGQFIQPAPNTASEVSPNDISTLTNDSEVIKIFERSCYDCHSDNTKYPWYAKVFPVSWYLYNHVEGGRKKLNFSQFASYDIKRRNHKLDEIKEYVEKDNMPLSSYKLIHPESKLSDDDKQKIYTWVQSMTK